jgi:hypothetical protein
MFLRFHQHPQAGAKQMTTQPVQAVLDPFGARQMFATLSHPAGASAQDITELRAESLAWLAELAPRDRVQSALAVRRSEICLPASHLER